MRDAFLIKESRDNKFSIQHSKEDQTRNEKSRKGNFKVTSNVLFPKVTSGKIAYFIIFLYNLTHVNILFGIYNFMTKCTF